MMARLLLLTMLLGGLSIPVHAGNISPGGPVPRLGGIPTVSGCGVSPSVVGTDSGGRIQVGSGVIATCTLTFSATYATAPTCIIGPASVLAVQVVTVTTTTLVVTGTSLTSVPISYACVLP